MHFWEAFDLGIGIDFYLPQCMKCALSTYLIFVTGTVQWLPGHPFAASSSRASCNVADARYTENHLPTKHVKNIQARLITNTKTGVFESKATQLPKT